MPSLTRNAFDVAHGGALTTYVDIATTTAIYAFDKKSRTSVSASLDMQFFSPAVIGDEFTLEARVEKFGKGICYSNAALKDQKGALVCSGTHIKAFINKEWKVEQI